MNNNKYYVHDNYDLENKKFDAARKLYAEHNYTSALKLYLDMVNTSVSYKLYYEIGRCYYKLEQYDKAQMSFQHSIDIESNNNFSHMYMGNIYFKQKDYTKALNYWMRAYIQKPEDANICLNIANSYTNKKNNFLAILFYERYLKYAQDKNSPKYQEVKNSITQMESLSNHLYEHAKRAIKINDYKTSTKLLNQAVKLYPTNYSANLLLAKLYNREKNYLYATVYLKQAYFISSNSAEVLELLSSVLFNIGDFNGGYCCLKRLQNILIDDVKERTNVDDLLSKISTNFDSLSYRMHINMAEDYIKNNNYYLALFEYENSFILNEKCLPQIEAKMNLAKAFINAENNTIELFKDKGNESYQRGDYKQSNKYFSKVLAMAENNSSEYKYAKSKLVNI